MQAGWNPSSFFYERVPEDLFFFWWSITDREPPFLSYMSSNGRYIYCIVHDRRKKVVRERICLCLNGLCPFGAFWIWMWLRQRGRLRRPLLIWIRWGEGRFVGVRIENSSGKISKSARKTNARHGETPNATQSTAPHSRHNTLKSDTVSKVRHTQAKSDTVNHVFSPETILFIVCLLYRK